MKREAKERQSAGGGDKRSDKAKSVEVNLPQAVEKKRNPQTSEQVAKKMGVSRKTYEGMKTVVAEGSAEQIERMDKGGNLTKVRQMRRATTELVRDIMSSPKLNQIDHKDGRPEGQARDIVASKFK